MFSVASMASYIIVVGVDTPATNIEMITITTTLFGRVIFLVVMGE